MINEAVAVQSQNFPRSTVNGRGEHRHEQRQQEWEQQRTAAELRSVGPAINISL